MDRDRVVLASLLTLPPAWWRNYRPVALPPALRRRLEQADRRTLQTLLVEVAARLHERSAR